MAAEAAEAMTTWPGLPGGAAEAPLHKGDTVRFVGLRSFNTLEGGVSW